MPRVSVIIPTYNRADLLGATLASVFAQTVSDIEVLVVDDGSTDGTADLLSTYGERLVYRYQRNQGQGAARNTGLRLATGELIAFLDSDDLWAPDKLARQLAALDMHPECPWVYTDAYVFDGASGRRQYLYSKLCRPYQGDVAPQLLLCNFIASPTPMLRRVVFDAVGWFDEQTPQVEDWDMWLRVAARYPVALVPQVLAGYRLHQATSTALHTPLTLHRKASGTIERVAALEPDVYGPWRAQAHAQLCIRTGRMLVSRGAVQEARRFFARASRHAPDNWLAYLLWGSCLAGGPAMSTLVKLYRTWRHRASLGGMAVASRLEEAGSAQKALSL